MTQLVVSSGWELSSVIFFVIIVLSCLVPPVGDKVQSAKNLKTNDANDTRRVIV